MSRTIINFVTIIFVIGAFFFLAKANKLSISTVAPTYIGQLKNDVEKFFTGIDAVTTTKKPMTPIGQVVVPGPLKKITPAGSSVTPAAPSPVTSTESAGSLTVKGIVMQTNVQRADHSTATLKENVELDASAKVKAQDILSRQYFEHTAPDGKTVSDLVGAQGYTYIKIGENLALGNFKDDTDVVAAWMASPGHRANILDPQFTEIGVGVASGMYQGRLVSVAVQHFGRPRAACPAVSTMLGAEVQTGQTELTKLSDTLNAEKATIDQGTSQGKNMDSEITAYNLGVEKYQTNYTHVDALRTQYNAEVEAFNSCISSVK